MSEISPEVGALLDRAGTGDAAAAASLERHFKALHGEGVGASSTPATGLRDDPGTAQAAIRSALDDAAFMAKVHSGDEAAIRRWNGLHQAAFPEAAPERSPPLAEHYMLPAPPPGFEPAPELEQAFRSAASAFGLDIGAAAELVEAYHQTAMLTEHMSEADLADMAADGLVQLRREPGVLDRARHVYAQLQRSHPEVAQAISQSGAGANAVFVRLLAHHARG